MKRMIASLGWNWFSRPRDGRIARLLFASTARAGRWNHRFLVPHGETRSDSDLDQFAGKASPQIARASHKVTQQEGREGDEMLVLVDDRLTALDDESLAKVNSLLEQQLSQLERLVTKDIDWNQWPSEPPLVVPCEQLDVLQMKVNELLARLSRPNQRWFAMLPFAGLALATILLVSLGLVVLAQRQGGRIPGGSSPSAESVALSPKEAKRFNDLAKLVGFRVANLADPLTDATCEDLAEHLEDQLFGGPVPDQTRLPDQQLKAPSLERTEGNTQQVAKQFKSKTHGRDRLSNVLNHVGKTVGKGRFDNWMDIGLDEEALSRLFPDGKSTLSPLGLLKKKSDQMLLQGMTPQTLWPVAKQFHDLHQAVRQLPSKEPDDDYDDFFNQVRTLKFELPVEGPRRYFVPSDAEAAMQLDGLLRLPETAKLYQSAQSIEQPTEVPLQILDPLQAVGNAAEDMKTSFHLNKNKLSDRIDASKGKPKEKVFQSLKDFVEACRAASKELQPAKSTATSQ